MNDKNETSMVTPAKVEIEMAEPVKKVESSETAKFTYHTVPYVFPAKNIPEAQATRPSNFRKSTTYTWWNFLPISIGMQFLKLTNCFYLFTGILQTFRTISTNSPFAIFIPLSFVVSLGVLLELLAECKRYREDKKTNAIPAVRLRSTVINPKKKNLA
jgi:hypothetical protein